MSTQLYPVFLDLRGKTVLVVGGGAVATRKVQSLLDTGASIRVGAVAFDEQLVALHKHGRVCCITGEFDASWLDQAQLVIAATDDRLLNQRISELANAKHVFVNVVDDAPLSSFQSPARVKRGPLQIAISSGGSSPMLARYLREKLETELDDSLGELARLFEKLRSEIRSFFPDLARRRRFFDVALRGEALQQIRAGKIDAAEQAMRNSLRENAAAPAARVALVGAGPGDPGLLTLRALRVLNLADVILCDQLVSAEVLELARRDAEVIAVGKRGGGSCTAQAEIHNLMLEHARAGKFVVRLKGGDPFVFGRGGEELEFLRAHQIAYEVVPGITAALACAAYSGIPLTHRNCAQSVRFVTAHCKGSQDELDWPALAQERQTLAIYMGASTTRRLQQKLLMHGRDRSTPFAIIENGTRANQRVISGVLSQLTTLVERHSVQAPSLLIIGEVAAYATQLSWFGPEPIVEPGAITPSAPRLLTMAEAA